MLTYIKKSINRKWVWLPFFVCLAVIFLLQFFFKTKQMPAISPIVKTSAAHSILLEKQVEVLGALVAPHVEITPEIAGHVKQILFQDGAFVKKDTVLIQLDDALYQAKQISAKAQLIYSENNLKRMTLLGKKGVVSKQAIEQAEADFKEKQANAEEITAMINKMQLLAPFDGYVGKSRVNVGDYVTVGQGVVTITDTQHLRIEYTIPENYLPSLKLGQIIKIEANAYPQKQFLGKVSFISPVINTENHSISIYADLLREKNLLIPGMFVNIKHLIEQKEQILMVPAKSLVPVLDGMQVYKVVAGKAYATSVTIGRRTEKEVEIVSGLSAGDVVVTDGQLKMKDGMAVKTSTS